jgi:lysyl-tRNA synthetase class 2
LSVIEQERLVRKKNRLILRTRIIQRIREFFIQNEYLEVETPILIPAPAPEVHIDAVQANHDWFLHTSPELCMKRLLAADYPKIFQVCKCFRQGERGGTHLPEFTLLEWYRSGTDYLDLMDECEKMILFITRELGFGERVIFHNQTIHLNPPWNRMSVQEAFAVFSLISMEEALRTDQFDEIMVEKIEPRLDPEKPLFLYDYPVSLASLAKAKTDEPGVCERFELYIGGLELANAFSELTDVKEQEKRFLRDRAKRENMGKSAYPIPEKFLDALQNMPPSAGIALGVDRLVMILTDAARIDDVVSFTAEEL